MGSTIHLIGKINVLLNAGTNSLTLCIMKYIKINLFSGDFMKIA